MYRRRTATGRYVPARTRAPRASTNASTPACSMSARSSHRPPRPRGSASPAAMPPTGRHAWRCGLYSAWKRRPGCCLAAVHSRRCNWRTLSADSRPPGWLDLPSGHALARACVTDLAPAGTLRSPRVVRRAARHYYGPLGLPLRRARFRRWLIRNAPPRPGLRRRVSRVSSGPLSACCAPYPAETCRVVSGLRRSRHGLRRDMTSSALGL